MLSKIIDKEPLFVENEIYKRSNLHDQYGGSRQGGISTLASYPFIFIFSGEAGQQHGYKDQWENESVFSYTGEGQINDMVFARGNLALREHMEKGKRVFLFSYIKKGMVRYEAELELLTVDFFPAKDKNGNVRNAIKFFLKKVGAKITYPLERFPSLEETTASITKDIPNETERKGLVTSRVGQGAYRKSVLFRWDFKCAVTNYSIKEILIASHIVPWRDSTNEERLDVNNSILLSPTYDALFDQFLISFENNGKIILADSLKQTDYKLIGISGKECIKKLSHANIPYLERHRQNLS